MPAGAAETGPMACLVTVEYSLNNTPVIGRARHAREVVMNKTDSGQVRIDERVKAGGGSGRGVLTSALLVALCFGFGSSAWAQVTSVNGKIAYVVCESVNSDSQCDIWVMNPDGTGQTNVTATSTLTEQNPVWSADGTKIAYIEGTVGFNYLKVLDLGVDGTGRTVTTISGPFVQGGPTWSPGGTQIALVRQVPGVVMTIQSDIFVINVDGSGETNITNSDFEEIDPAWAPDGSKIAFAGVRPLGNDLGPEYAIVTVNPDGSGEQILTAGDPGTPRATGLDGDRAPAWSPDSSTLVFMSEAQYPFGCCRPWQIWTVNRDGTGVTNLTNDDTVYEMGPSWSPDGTQILFYRQYVFPVEGQVDGLYTMPAPTSSPLAVATLSSTTTALAAATSSATLLAADASDSDWGRDPSSVPPNVAYTLFVSVLLEGKGAGGTVASDLKGINCGRDCSEPYASGTLVTLTAKPRRNSAFVGWSGACAEIIGSSCRVTMNDAKTVTATFSR